MNSTKINGSAEIGVKLFFPIDGNNVDMKDFLKIEGSTKTGCMTKGCGSYKAPFYPHQYLTEKISEYYKEDKYKIFSLTIYETYNGKGEIILHVSTELKPVMQESIDRLNKLKSSIEKELELNSELKDNVQCKTFLQQIKEFMLSKVEEDILELKAHKKPSSLLSEVLSPENSALQAKSNTF
jgi:hypothetical protein